MVTPPQQPLLSEILMRVFGTIMDDPMFSAGQVHELRELAATRRLTDVTTLIDVLSRPVTNHEDS